MEVNFDKQTDAILRDLARGKSFAETPQNTHLDADELSAFAENALPAKARLRTMEHLADCPKCRNILGNLTELNAETESETIHEPAGILASIPKIPWYRSLFAFPNLAYTMGALTVLLGGTITFLVFQNSRDAEMNVAQADKTYEKPNNIGGTSSEGDSTVNETSANSAANAANVAIPAANAPTSSNSTVSANTASSASETAGKSQPTPAKVADADLADESGSKEVAKLKDKSETEVVASKGGESLEMKKDASDEKPGSDAPKPVTAAEPKPTESTDKVITQRQVQEIPNVARNQSNIVMPDAGQNSSRNAPPAPMKKSAPRSESSKDRRDSSASELDRERSNNYVVTRSVGSKTFQSINGVWTDSVYKGGSTKTVKRSSAEYKKLDSGLQNIGNSLSGTVIVVWDGKNYRIQ